MPRIAIRPGLLESLDDASGVHLLGGLCGDCRRRHFPAETLCPYCGADGCETVRLSRRGTLFLCTTVLSRPPGYDGPIPYGFGIVELPDGIRIISRIIDPAGLTTGTPVELAFDSVGTDEDGRDLVSYAFRRSPHQPPTTSRQ